MTVFGWSNDELDPPSCWDLRACGWSLCRCPPCSSRGCSHPLLVDAAGVEAAELLALVESSRTPRRLLLLAVEDGDLRAALLARGCGEALPGRIPLSELEARARKLAEAGTLLPRTRQAGALMLDLFHRDARLGSEWLALHPREFGLLWRLADDLGERVTRRDLLRDVWRINHEPETNSVEVHVSRLRSKLAGVGCEALVETATEGGYRLVAPPPDAEIGGSSYAFAGSPFARTR